MLSCPFAPSIVGLVTCVTRSPINALRYGEKVRSVTRIQTTRDWWRSRRPNRSKRETPDYYRRSEAPARRCVSPRALGPTDRTEGIAVQVGISRHWLLPCCG